MQDAHFRRNPIVRPALEFEHEWQILGARDPVQNANARITARYQTASISLR